MLAGLQDVTFEFGARVIVKDATWHIQPNERIGLIGYNGPAGAISNASASASVSDGAESVGGLIGYNDAPIANVSATGSVTSPSAFYVGGLVGDNGSAGAEKEVPRAHEELVEPN